MCPKGLPRSFSESPLFSVIMCPLQLGLGSFNKTPPSWMTEPFPSDLLSFLMTQNFFSADRVSLSPLFEHRVFSFQNPPPMRLYPIRLQFPFPSKFAIWPPPTPLTTSPKGRFYTSGETPPPPKRYPPCPFRFPHPSCEPFLLFLQSKISPGLLPSVSRTKLTSFCERKSMIPLFFTSLPNRLYVSKISPPPVFSLALSSLTLSNFPRNVSRCAESRLQSGCAIFSLPKRCGF